MNDLEFDDRGLVPGIVQHAETGEVLMHAYLDSRALSATLETGFVHFWSRSRQALWKKGETSGNVLELVSLRTDCDRDTILISAIPAGPTCHTGARTCFDAPDESAPAPAGFGSIDRLWATIAERAAMRPEGSYTATLVAAGVDAVGRKVLEEAAEVVEAALLHARRDGSPDRVDEEAADLLYHLLVMLAERGRTPAAMISVLRNRSR